MLLSGALLARTESCSRGLAAPHWATGPAREAPAVCWVSMWAIGWCVAHKGRLCARVLGLLRVVARTTRCVALHVVCVQPTLMCRSSPLKLLNHSSTLCSLITSRSVMRRGWLCTAAMLFAVAVSQLPRTHATWLSWHSSRLTQALQGPYRVCGWS